MRVWGWGDVESVDGEVKRATGGMIDAMVRVKGFASAMQAQGWIELLAGGIRFPNWERNNSASAKERAMTQARTFKWRNRHATVAEPSRDRLLERDKTTQTTQTTQTNTPLPPFRGTGADATNGEYRVAIAKALGVTDCKTTKRKLDRWVASCEELKTTPTEVARKMAAHRHRVGDAKCSPNDLFLKWSEL